MKITPLKKSITKQELTNRIVEANFQLKKQLENSHDYLITTIIREKQHKRIPKKSIFQKIAQLIKGLIYDKRNSTIW